MLTPRGWQEAGRPQQVPLEPLPHALGQAGLAGDALANEVRRQLGGEQAVLRTPAGTPVLMHAEAFAAHLDPARSAYLPLLRPLIEEPWEQWIAFERHRGTGRVVLRSRLIRAFDIGRGRGVLFVANASGGALEGWTLIPSSDWRYLNRQRRGMLVYAREEIE